MGEIVIFTRGGEGFGTGHLHRSLWIYRELTEKLSPGAVRILCVETEEAKAFWHGRSGLVGFIRDPWTEDDGYLASLVAGEKLAIVDWLDSAPASMAALKAAAGKLALIDDCGEAMEHADLVIDALLAPVESDDATLDGTRYLSGARYVQLPPTSTYLKHIHTHLQRESVRIASQNKGLRRVRSVLINFGGSANLEATQLVLDSLAELDFRGFVYIIPAPKGLSYPAEMDVREMPAGDHFHTFVSASGMMVCAGGLALYEAAMFGTPAVSIALVDHQEDNARKLQGANTCVYAGRLGSLEMRRLTGIIRNVMESPLNRYQMRMSGPQVVDGMGLKRTVDALLELFNE